MYSSANSDEAEIMMDVIGSMPHSEIKVLNLVCINGQRLFVLSHGPLQQRPLF